MAVLKRRKPKISVDLGLVDGDVSTPDELRDYAQKNGISLVPLDIEELIRVLGIGLRIHPLPDQKSGYMRFENGRWIIGVNSLHHPNRQRFTMAHELGHYILHKDEIGNFEDTILFRQGSDFTGAPLENEANQFASELLMPENEFRDVVPRLSGQIDDIAKHFQVSSAALKMRGEKLGFRIS